MIIYSKKKRKKKKRKDYKTSKKKVYGRHLSTKLFGNADRSPPVKYLLHPSSTRLFTIDSHA